MGLLGAIDKREKEGERDANRETRRACLVRCKTSQVVSCKMRMEKVNCSSENILCFTVFG